MNHGRLTGSRRSQGGGHLTAALVAAPGRLDPGPDCRVYDRGLLSGGFFTQGVVFSYSGIETAAVAPAKPRMPGRRCRKPLEASSSGSCSSKWVPCWCSECFCPPISTAVRSRRSRCADGFEHRWLPSVMSIVVLTASISGIEATLCVAGRAVRTPASNIEAPKFTARMTKGGGPIGILGALGDF